MGEKRITLRDEQIYDAYLKEIEVRGEKGAQARAAKLVGVNPSAVSQVKSKVEELQEINKGVMIKDYEELGKCLTDFQFQSQKRIKWMERLEDNLDHLEDHISNTEEMLEELRVYAESIYVDQEKHPDRWAILQSILQILRSRHSPIHTTAFFQESRKTIDTMSRLLDSSNTSLTKLLRVEQFINSLEFGDLPEALRKRYMTEMIKGACGPCPGKPYRDAWIREQKANERKRKLIDDDDTVIEVEYGEVDD